MEPWSQRKRTPQYRLGPECLQHQSVHERAQKRPRPEGPGRLEVCHFRGAAQRSPMRCPHQPRRPSRRNRRLGRRSRLSNVPPHLFPGDALQPPPSFAARSLVFLRQPPLRVFRNAYNFLMLLRLSNSISVPASELHISTYAASELVIKFTSPGWDTF